MSPAEKRAALNAAIDQGAQRARIETEQRMQAELNRRQQAQEANMALSMVQAMNPELADPRNAPAFGAAMTKVKMEAEQRGENLSYGQLTARAVEDYRRYYSPKSQVPRPPYTEGARPDPNGVPAQPAAPAGPSVLESLYGFKKPGVIQQIPNTDDEWSELNQSYVTQHNSQWKSKGVVSDIPQVWAALDEQK